CNRFVAGFIGWPSMNMVDGQLGRESGQYCFQTQGWSLPVPTRWETLGEREVTLGMRPEHLHLAGDGQPGAVLDMEATLGEILGAERLVILQRDGWNVTAKVNAGQRIETGQKVRVVFDMQQAHWFDRLNGLRLEVPAG